MTKAELEEIYSDLTERQIVNTVLRSQLTYERYKHETSPCLRELARDCELMIEVGRELLALRNLRSC